MGAGGDTAGFRTREGCGPSHVSDRPSQGEGHQLGNRSATQTRRGMRAPMGRVEVVSVAGPGALKYQRHPPWHRYTGL